MICGNLLFVLVMTSVYAISASQMQDIPQSLLSQQPRIHSHPEGQRSHDLIDRIDSPSAIGFNSDRPTLEDHTISDVVGDSRRLSTGNKHLSTNSNQSPSTVSVDNQGYLVPSNLELALRQASGDESVFQPLPPIGAPGLNNFEWQTSAPMNKNHQYISEGSSTTSKSVDKNRQNDRAPIEQHQSSLVQLQDTANSSRAIPLETYGDNLSNQIEPIVLNHQQSISMNSRELQNIGNTSLEFNNQVIYEGPATPPSGASSGDYYHSSSEKIDKDLANSHSEYSHSNVWWALGTNDELEKVNNLTRGNYIEYCDKSQLLINSKQRSLCRMHPRVMSIVGRGLKMAIDECQAKFASNRWNCSLISRGGGLDFDESNDRNHLQKSIFGDVMLRPNRERSFLNAIIAAGIAHSMTKACSQGELPDECSCDRKIKSRNNKGRIEWVACSDDIDFGARFSREFTDNFDSSETDATSTIYMHNSEVGRRIFKSATDITCTCLNSDNGLCQTKRCWKHLGSYADVVDELIKRYDSATHVQRSNKDPQKLRPVRRGVRKPKRKDLVYIDESPDYCRRDLSLGVLGTQNRLCNSTSHGPDSCSLLCCGRGFQTVVEHMEEECNCKFVWCCQVKCDKCNRFVTNDVCN